LQKELGKDLCSVIKLAEDGEMMVLKKRLKLSGDIGYEEVARDVISASNFNSTIHVLRAAHVKVY
jgi:hypothetical protein